jgi:hypothetical protein
MGRIDPRQGDGDVVEMMRPIRERLEQGDQGGDRLFRVRSDGSQDAEQRAGFVNLGGIEQFDQGGDDGFRLWAGFHQRIDRRLPGGGILVREVRDPAGERSNVGIEPGNRHGGPWRKSDTESWRTES